MTREIKFRAWNINRKYMTTDNNNCFIFGLQMEDSPQIIEQFTGLLDKNGKEIYEGDIVTHETLGTDGSNMLVQWKNCYWIKKLNDDEDFLSENIEVTKVIGNIHENKELMKE